MLVGMLGSAAALILGGVISDSSTKLAFAIGCMVLAFVMRSRPSATLPLILIALGTLFGQFLYDLVHPLLAWAYLNTRGFGGEWGNPLGEGVRPTPGEMEGFWSVATASRPASACSG